jgi:hypothetical protein
MKARIPKLAISLISMNLDIQRLATRGPPIGSVLKPNGECEESERLN